jgi:signal peptidase I
MSKTDAEKETLRQKLKKLRKNGIFVTLLLLLVILIANFAIQGALTLILKTDQPLHTPISGSMEPTLNIGDLLIIQGGVTGESVYAHPLNGDIIIYHDPRDYEGIPIVHRAVDKYEVDGIWYIVTKGDNNPTVDDWRWYGFPVGGNYSVGGCPESYIVGKVILKIPYLGYVLRAFDETAINLGAFAISLRQILIVILLIALVYLELAHPEEKPKKPQEPEKQDETEKTV